jgi:rod shape-determining protein MreC
MEPVGSVLAAPGRWTGAGVDSVRGYFFAASENSRLKAELKEMRQWREVALALRDTNERYRTVLGLKTDPPIPMASALIVTDSRGPFANSRLANAGSEKGIKPGNPVMSENGLVGRVVGVTQGVSRVLMLTDAASRTPVMVDRTNARAILTGDGGPNPKMEYLRGQEPVKEGDRVLTSGDGGLFPAACPWATRSRASTGAGGWCWPRTARRSTTCASCCSRTSPRSPTAWAWTRSRRRRRRRASRPATPCRTPTRHKPPPPRP